MDSGVELHVVEKTDPDRFAVIADGHHVGEIRRCRDNLIEWKPVFTHSRFRLTWPQFERTMSRLEPRRSRHPRARRGGAEA